jgi:tetratricopeptide (TPR) repeat protein
MSEHFISREDAERDLLACAAYLAEAIQSNDGRAQAMIAVVPRYLEKAEVDLAAELANTVEDPYIRDRLLIAVAETCAAIDDDEYALQLVEAMEDPGMQAQAREKIGLRLASMGKLEKARAVADLMDHRDNVLAGVAIHQHAEGSVDESLATVGEIGFPSAAAHALVAMANVSVEKGDAERAAELLERSLVPAEEIEHEEERIRTLADIASSFIAAGRNDRAVETFDTARGHADVLDNIHRDNFLAAISLGFLRAGSLEFADRTLDSVRDKTQIATALLGFAREFWRNDDKTEAMDALDEAYSILKSQRESETRDSKARFALYANIAVQFAGFEKGERAIEIANEITDEEQAMNALSQIARVLTVRRDDDLARQALNGIPDDAYRMFALIALSDTVAESDEREKAVALLDEAIVLAEEVPQLASRSSAYVGIAQRFAKLDQTERFDAAVKKTLEMVTMIKDESTKAAALTELSALTDELGVTIGEGDRVALKAIVTQAVQRGF